MNNIFCSAPFVHLHIDKNGDVLPCCGAQDRVNTLFGNINNNSIQEIYNGEAINNFRQKLLNGIHSKACEGCYQVESNGGDSYRKWFNNTYPVKEEQVEIKYIDIRFSNFCNFKCRMCDGESSSSIKNEYLKLNNITNQKGIIELDKLKVFDFLNEHINTIDKIYFAGGEPLIMEEHYELLHMLLSNNKTDITLSYNTNLSTLIYKDQSIIDLWNNFKKVELYASLDGIFEIGEYIRDGLNYEKFESNIFNVNENCKSVITSVNICVNLFNIFHLFKMLPYVYSKGIINPFNFTMNILTTPYYQSITVLPIELKTLWVDYLENFKIKHNDPGYNKIISELDVIKNHMLSKDDSEHLEQFNYNVKKYDLIRNKDFFKLYDNLQPIV